jgi:hypothetical protein
VNDGFEEILEEAPLAFILDSFLVFVERLRTITGSSRM